MKIGVVGLGFVGKNLYRWFVESNQNVYGYDIDESKSQVKSFEEITSCDVIFLCLPTPYNEGKKGYDLKCLDLTIDKISQVNKNNLVIIKSTVTPRTTVDLS